MDKFTKAKELFNAGLLNTQNGEYLIAEENFTKSYEIYPERISILNNLTVIKTKIKKYDEAILYGQKSIELDSTNKLGYFNLGIIYLEKENYEKAVAYFQKTIEKDMNFAEAYFYLGQALNMDKKLIDSVEILNKYIEINSKDNQAKEYIEKIKNKINYEISINLKKIEILRSEERHKEALIEVNKLINLNKNNADLYNIKANIILENSALKNDFEDDTEVEINYLKAINLDSKFIEAIINLSTFYNNKGEYNKAIEKSFQAISINENIADAYFNIAYANQQLENTTESEVYYEKALDINKNDSRVMFGLGLIYFRQGKFKKSISLYQQCLEVDSNKEEIYFNLGVCYEKIKNINNAQEMYIKAISVNKKITVAYFNLASILKEKGEIINSLKTYEVAKKIEPEYELLMGEIFLLKQKICSWDLYDKRKEELIEKILQDKLVATPFALLNIIDCPKLQKKATEKYINIKHPENIKLKP